MKIGLMGFGHLGKAVLQGLLKTAYVRREDVLVSARSQETRQAAREQFGVQACICNEELVRQADVVILLLPPSVFRNEPINADWSGKTVISMMAGVRLAELKSLAGCKAVRAMPNLGVAEGKGMLCYTATEDQRVIDLLSSLGEAFCVAEDEVEKFMAVASCGIGFAAHILHGFVQAGESMGFTREQAMHAARNVFAYALKSPDFCALEHAVATRGGATEAGLDSMKKDDVAGAVERAVRAAYDKMA